MTSVFIGILVRNRDWVLPNVIKSLQALDYDKKFITLAFLVNNSTDESFNIVNEFQRQYQRDYNQVILAFNDSLTPEDTIKENGERTGNVRHKYIYQRLADLRNIMINFFMESNCEYYLSLDSDIIVKPNLLKRLLELGNPIASAIIYNDIGKGRIGNILNWNNVKQSFYHINLVNDAKDIIPCDASGACILFQRLVLENGHLRYEFDTQGEDLGLHRKTLKMGYRIQSVRGLATHIMARHLLPEEKIEEVIEDEL